MTNEIRKGIIMSRTDNFRRQHDEILNVAKEISLSLTPDKLNDQVNEVRKLLSSLTGKINVHLSMEDNALYPRMIQGNDANIKLTAQKFMTEMGEIKTVFTDYSKKWFSATSIKNSPMEFIKETKAIFAALEKRIQRENKELYPLVDKLNN